MKSFRPQQGLIIMNDSHQIHAQQKKIIWFPSPTGVNYYESMRESLMNSGKQEKFPSPTGVNYYELYIANQQEIYATYVSVPNRG